jgi:hypothetical protein
LILHLTYQLLGAATAAAAAAAAAAEDLQEGAAAATSGAGCRSDAQHFASLLPDQHGVQNAAWQLWQQHRRIWQQWQQSSEQQQQPSGDFLLQQQMQILHQQLPQPIQRLCCPTTGVASFQCHLEQQQKYEQYEQQHHLEQQCLRKLTAVGCCAAAAAMVIYQWLLPSDLFSDKTCPAAGSEHTWQQYVLPLLLQASQLIHTQQQAAAISHLTQTAASSPAAFASTAGEMISRKSHSSLRQPGDSRSLLQYSQHQLLQLQWSPMIGQQQQLVRAQLVEAHAPVQVISQHSNCPG